MKSFTPVVLVAAVLAGLAMTYGAHDAAEPKEPECVVAANWVEANLDALPTSLESFGEFDLVYRRAIYTRLDLNVRVALWQSHLEAVIKTDEELTADQISFLLEVRGDLTDLLGTEPKKSDLDDMSREAVEVLGRDLAIRAMATLGPLPVPERTEASEGDCTCNSDGFLWGRRSTHTSPIRRRQMV